MENRLFALTISYSGQASDALWDEEMFETSRLRVYTVQAQNSEKAAAKLKAWLKKRSQELGFHHLVPPGTSVYLIKIKEVARHLEIQEVLAVEQFCEKGQMGKSPEVVNLLMESGNADFFDNPTAIWKEGKPFRLAPIFCTVDVPIKPPAP